MAEIWRQKVGGPLALIVSDPHPMLQRGTQHEMRAIRIELAGTDGTYAVELSAAECERIVELLR
jgi:hypothetical protein